MKRYLLAAIAALTVISAAADERSQRDLALRLRNFDPEAFRLAVQDQNIPAATWEEALEKLSSTKEELIIATQAGARASMNDAEKLLNQLDKVLLSNRLLEGKQIMAIERRFADNARGRMSGEAGLAPSNFQNNSEIWNPRKGWDNSMVVIDGFGGDLKQKTFYKPADSTIISDLEPHFSGERMMYSSIGTDDRWHLFEIDLRTGETRQLTPDVYKDFDSFDGCYTVDGKYIFCSTGTFLGLPCTDGGNKMCGLFLYDPATGRTRQLTFDQDSNWNPVMMNNGQVLYLRWEYADIPHSNSRILFTMNPDGTSQFAYYGSGSYFPGSFFGVRPIPGSPTNSVVGIGTGHHSVSRSGRLLIVDPAKGRHEAEGIIAEIPHRGKKVEPIVRDRLPDGIWPQFLQPFPLSDKYFLVSMKPDPQSLWGIYLVDVFNNMTLISQTEDAGIFEPTLLGASQTPPLVPDQTEPGNKTATVFLQDVYFGDGLKDIPRGTVKKLRVGSFSFSPLNQGGLLGTIGLDGPWDVKRILGEVDVEKDGSVMFTVPSNTPIFVQPLDSLGRALQVMRSWFTAMPGEKLSCLGCHEDRNSVPIPKASLAARKAPQAIKEFYGPKRGVSFRHEVQPTLDRACVACHDGAKPGRPYLKGDSLVPDWSSQISGAVWIPEHQTTFTESYYQMQRYVRRPGIESDMKMLAPMDVHADQTELFQILANDHYGVELTVEEWEKLACWVDMNAPFFGRRSEIPSYPKTIASYEIRAKYAPMFGVEVEDLEWLPEIGETPAAVLPARKQAKPVGDTVVKGWPQYDHGRFHEAWNQIGLGQYQVSIDLGDGVTLDLVKVPAGSFVMGSDRGNNEKPMSVQNINKPFWIGRFEITNSQYALFDPAHDSRHEHRHGYQFGRLGYPLNNPAQPVVRISWREAMDFCDWLSEKTGMKISLPTEAEWEWACRAGSNATYSFGGADSDYTAFANLGDERLRDFAACTSYKFYESTRILPNPNRYDDWIPRDTVRNDGGFVSEEVGHYRANMWDIYDMHGNVWEWTLSAYEPYPYDAGDGRNDAGPGPMRAIRGGSWYDRPHKATSSFRMGYRDYQKVYNVGFRIVVHEDEIAPAETLATARY